MWPDLIISSNNIFSLLFPPSPYSPRNREGFVDLISLIFRKSWGTGWGQDAESSCACGECVQGEGEACQVTGYTYFKAGSRAISLDQHCPNRVPGCSRFCRGARGQKWHQVGTCVKEPLVNPYASQLPQTQ